MDYATLKLLHLTFVGLSLTGFLVRYFLTGYRPTLLRRPLLRILPHVNDTLLFAAGIGLAVLRRLSPFAVPWFGAKLLWLLVYIVAGSIALGRGHTPRGRRIALVLALCAFAQIVGCALRKSPWGWFG
ncbi:SirB2 family protein [Tepidiphilus margaritifer]|uniref:SirB2 family protein n=1 Tax=Tepidiphilus margaritifer TaxID=203471 RepID=UPI0003FCF803|nr:SirB2 family protein [Tepidiphilus margaritifer]